MRYLDAFNIPIITFVDVPGFMPGTAQVYLHLVLRVLHSWRYFWANVFLYLVKGDLYLLQVLGCIYVLELGIFVLCTKGTEGAVERGLVFVAPQTGLGS